MSDQYIFRMAESYQADEICRLVNSAYRGESSKRGWTTEADFLDGQRTDVEKVTELILKKNSIILIATLDDRIYGSVNLEIKGPDCYLGMLTVAPQTQGAGLGKLLMSQSEQWARQRHCQSIFMTVLTIRDELICWYERRGFRRTGKFENFKYGDPAFGIPKRSDLRFEILTKNL